MCQRVAQARRACPSARIAPSRERLACARPGVFTQAQLRFLVEDRGPGSGSAQAVPVRVIVINAPERRTNGEIFCARACWLVV